MIVARLRRLLALLAVLLVIGVPAVAAPFTYPPPVIEAYPTPSPPQISAPSWILYDDTAGVVVAERNAEESRAIASVTKIMTGLLALESSSPEEMAVVSNRATETGEKEIGLVAGERLSMGALFKALMIPSANDAATAIAEQISGSVEDFVALMNRRAEELGMTGTSFANPHGLDASGNYSTARDLLTLTLAAMEYPEFAAAVRAKALSFPPAPDGTGRSGSSTNLMLRDYPGAIGVKTGFTNQALLTLVAAAERGGRRLYAVVLGSEGEQGHFADATRLFDYGFDQLAYYGYALTGSPYTAATARAQPDPLVAEGSIETYLHLAGQGLVLGAPPPDQGSDSAPEPVAVTVLTRSPDALPDSVVAALRFWIDRALGTR